ncbi:hypothetical protein EUX98_g4660 [Antrodiella citrinella]|uniref:Uncharacterized protein n=1 Tax=Antrodiella citrinella TaxID=2447956 RepID=A0A4S4MVA2_9APHY|nr:hypothetical protein EUX98_g4660 [Antrodiella citrinella]
MLQRTKAIRRCVVPKRVVVPLAVVQSRSDIIYRSLRLLPVLNYKTPPALLKPKPVLDFDYHMLDTYLIPRSLAAISDHIVYRGL